MTAQGDALVAFARTMLGTPYVWGASGANGNDCSGFVHYVTSRVLGPDHATPRASSAYRDVGTPVASLSDCRPGDILCYQTTIPGQSGITHVGIYAGSGRMVNALNEDAGVVESGVTTSYWTSRFLYGRRIVADSSPGDGTGDAGGTDMPTPISGPATATLGQVLTAVKNTQPKNGDDAVRHVRELFRLGGLYGYNPVVLVAQTFVETGKPGAGWREPYESDAWVTWKNPAGIGITDGPNRTLTYSTGTDAARAQIIHMAGYVQGDTGWVVDSPYKALDPQWDALTKHPKFGRVRNVEDLGSGVWATQDSATYAGNILAAMRFIEGAAAPEPPKPEPEQPTPTDPTPTPGNGAPVMPDIQWLGTDNYHARGMDVLGFVFHITADEILSNTVSWFQDPDSNASSHFVIARDGTILQFVSSTNAAWTNGDHKNPHMWVAYCKEMDRRGVNWNNGCITFECVATSGDRVTEAQYQSLEALVKYFCHPSVYGTTIKRTRGWFVRHADINTIDRAFDPGPGFDLARIIESVGGDPADLT